MRPIPGRKGPFVALVAGHAVSLTGNMLTLVAVPLYVLATTGSAAAMGLVGAFATAPLVIGGAFGGVLADRIGYRRTGVVADTLAGVTIVAVPLLEWSVGLPFWALAALVFAAGLFDSPGQTARSALLPEIAAAAGVSIERAVGVYEATERGARLVGAPLAGLLVAGFGPVSVLALDSATFFAAAVLLAVLVPKAVVPARGDDGGEPGAGRHDRGYWREFAAGLRFLSREPLLRAIVALVLVTNVFDAAKSTVLLPLVAQRELGGATTLGILIGVSGGGALVGALAFSAFAHRFPRRATFVVAFTLVGAPPFLALAAKAPLPVVIGVFAVSGVAAGAVNPIIGSIKLERVPAGMRARVYGVITAGSWLAMPLGSVGAGLAVTSFGATSTLTGMAICYLLVTLSPLLGGPWRSMRRPAVEAQTR
ncbi:MFS transporter [Streptosporangium sp. NPDC023615]|uniref:MFS transporter n=1 Tax=Streptosporangium sp. NPDC023615 TaxID=3154794 RepID=UPI003412E5D7